MTGAIAGFFVADTLAEAGNMGKQLPVFDPARLPGRGHRVDPRCRHRRAGGVPAVAWIPEAHPAHHLHRCLLLPPERGAPGLRGGPQDLSRRAVVAEEQSQPRHSRDRRDPAPRHRRRARVHVWAVRVRHPHQDGARDASGRRGQGDRRPDGHPGRPDHHHDVRRRRRHGRGGSRAVRHGVPHGGQPVGFPPRHQGVHGGGAGRHREHARCHARGVALGLFESVGPQTVLFGLRWEIPLVLGIILLIVGTAGLAMARSTGRQGFMLLGCRRLGRRRRQPARMGRHDPGPFQIKDVVAFYALFLVLIFRPAGLLGERLASEDRA